MNWTRGEMVKYGVHRLGRVINQLGIEGWVFGRGRVFFNFIRLGGEDDRSPDLHHRDVTCDVGSRHKPRRSRWAPHRWSVESIHK